VTETGSDHGGAFPLIRNARGGPSADGANLLVEALSADGGSVRFAVPLEEVKHFVSFLLVSVGKIAAFQRNYGASGESEESMPCRPIPVTSIGIGQPEDGEGYLQVAVGRAELLFAVPIAAFEPVGRSMLLASVQATDKPSA
jgi:hypothetical protein